MTNRRQLFSGLAIVVCFVVVLGVFYVCFKSYAEGRSDAQRRNRRSHMFEVIGALQSYDDIYHRIPQAVFYSDSGIPLRSWRTEILPFTSRPSRIPNGDLAWNHPLNAPVTQQPLGPYCFDDDWDTNVVAVAGDGTAFDSMAKHRLRDIPADTIVLIEIANSNIPWAAPGDLDMSDLASTVTFGTDGRGVHVAFADQVIWCLGRDTPLKKLEIFFRIEGAKQHDRDELLGSYVVAP